MTDAEWHAVVDAIPIDHSDPHQCDDCRHSLLSDFHRKSCA